MAAAAVKRTEAVLFAVAVPSNKSAESLVMRSIITMLATREIH